MSGGYWNYMNDTLMGEIFQYAENAKEAVRINPLGDKIISAIVYDVFELLHDFDWKISCDICEETYRKRVKEFKKKWLKMIDQTMVKQIVDDTIDDAKKELYKAFEVE